MMSVSGSSGMVGRSTIRRGRVAAIYARVSSDRQRREQTIQSQTVALRELAAKCGLLVTENLVFEDEGVSGAVLRRSALERLRDVAVEGRFEVLLCHAPDRLARRYAYQVLLLEEFARAGVAIVFALEGERTETPEGELLRQFQGMIAEYERHSARGMSLVMPRVRLCRAEAARRGFPLPGRGWRARGCRHNYRLARNASKLSRAW
jgi:DNA invertase Pin-like site-specific DNA recombinase